MRRTRRSRRCPRSCARSKRRTRSIGRAWSSKDRRSSRSATASSSTQATAISLQAVSLNASSANAIAGATFSEQALGAFGAVQGWGMQSLVSYYFHAFTLAAPKAKLPPAAPGAFAMRTRLGFFGHNAPALIAGTGTTGMQTQDLVGDGDLAQRRHRLLSRAHRRRHQRQQLAGARSQEAARGLSRHDRARGVAGAVRVERQGHGAGAQCRHHERPEIQGPRDHRARAERAAGARAVADRGPIGKGHGRRAAAHARSHGAQPAAGPVRRADRRTRRPSRREGERDRDAQGDSAQRRLHDAVLRIARVDAALRPRHGRAERQRGAGHARRDGGRGARQRRRRRHLSALHAQTAAAHLHRVLVGNRRAEFAAGPRRSPVVERIRSADRSGAFERELHRPHRRRRKGERDLRRRRTWRAAAERRRERDGDVPDRHRRARHGRRRPHHADDDAAARHSRRQQPAGRIRRRRSREPRQRASERSADRAGDGPHRLAARRRGLRARVRGHRQGARRRGLAAGTRWVHVTVAASVAAPASDGAHHGAARLSGRSRFAARAGTSPPRSTRSRSRRCGFASTPISRSTSTSRAKVSIDPRYEWSDVETGIRAALISAFSFDERRFAQSVSLAEVVRVLHSVAGVVFVDVDTLAALRSDIAGPARMAACSAPRACSGRTTRPSRARWRSCCSSTRSGSRWCAV